MTSAASPPPPTPARTLWIEGAVEDLFEALLADHGFEERSMMVSDGISVPDGLYVERTTGGLLVWVPPDPQRTGGDPAILPPAVRIEAERSGPGTRLALHRVTAPATVLNLASAAGLTALAAGGAWWLGGTYAWVAFGLLAAVVWGALAQQVRVAAARAQLAWDALQPALGQLQLPEPAGSTDPYR
ncbi:MAG: hypothetical protein AAGA54_32850 [Myxococcota bacterium]